MSRRKKSASPRFVQLYHWEMDTPAYKHLNTYGRALLIEFRRRYNGHNNGEIVMSVRQAAALLNCNKDTALRVLGDLEAKGWIRLHQKGSFSQKTKKTASKWRITNQPVGLGLETPETKEFSRWRPSNKNQKPVPLSRTACPTRPDRDQNNGPTTTDRTPPICPSKSDRDPSKAPSTVPLGRTHLYLPYGA